MPTSVEVRWFFSGPVTDEIKQWFGRSESAFTASPREDHYLAFPASLGLNVKLREGRLEIKSLAKALGVRNFTMDTAGYVQMWEKRLGGNAAVKEFEKLRTSASHLWVVVKKERTLRKFSLDGDAIKEVDAGQVFLSEGCNVELTKIAVNGSAYWSFALEAYGDSAQVEESLMRVAAHVLSDNRRPHGTLSAGNSYSYPEWLGRFSKKA